ncbi:cadmium resistance transporter [Limosilactobacillus caecicola]|uniref:cadmium resistance transporter n=1 Tax=Limosilactobacillus caecicola TaxID=2941332 RepID=UPI00203F67BC|nr:cadmium resistance transporter [Limosilactobacillus caecicola]
MNWILITTTFLAVNLDFFVILLFLCQRFTTRQVISGYLLGLAILITAAFLAGQILLKFLPEWLLGVLGVIPIWAALSDNDEDPTTNHQHSPVLTVLITYLSVCAGCNLSLFLPVLATQTWANFGLILAYIGVLTIFLVLLIARFGQLTPVQHVLNRWGEPLMKLCYIGIGIYVFFDSGLVHHLISLI